MGSADAGEISPAAAAARVARDPHRDERGNYVPTGAELDELDELLDGMTPPWALPPH